jgi:hypothetical protein
MMQCSTNTGAMETLSAGSVQFVSELISLILLLGGEDKQLIGCANRTTSF